MAEQNETAVRRMIEDHWNKKQFELVNEVFLPNVSIHTPDGTLGGLEGASFLLQAYATAFPDFRLDVEDLLAAGEEVAFRWTFTGTQSGALGAIPATSRQVRIPGCIAIARLSSGKVERLDMSWDRYELMQQLGVLPAAAPAAQV